jgi:hypothetical protein
MVAGQALAVAMICSNHMHMPVPRCAARRRDGQSCGALASSPTAVFCRHHEALATELGGEAVRAGSYPRRRTPREETLLVVETTETPETTPMTNGTITPAEVRPKIAQMTAESVVEIQQALLHAALGATKEYWTTFTCPDCGKKHRGQVAVPDVRARVGAIEVLLREGLGRPAQAEDSTAPDLPKTVSAIRTMSWADMEYFAAALLTDELTSVQRDGGEQVLRDRVGALGDDQRQILRDALAEHTA